MSLPEASGGPAGSADAEAAAWVVRHERGLTPEEQDTFSAWLAADPRHRRAYADQRWSWDQLDRLNGLQVSGEARPEEPFPTRRRARPPWASAVVAAAALAAGLILLLVERPRPPVPAEAIPMCQGELLADGTRIDLNRGAAIRVQYTADERRVRLERGEAHFAVAPDRQRPFVVEVDGVSVRAVGTAFSARRGPETVAVLVTEGTVALTSLSAPHDEAAPRITAGQRAVVALASPETATLVEAVAAGAIEAHLAWRPRLLEFDETPLSEIAAEFNRRNPVRLEINDPALRARRLSATLRSDNVEGFVRMLESEFGITANRTAPGVIALQARR